MKFLNILSVFTFLLIASLSSYCQNTDEEIKKLQKELEELKNKQDSLYNNLENLRLQGIKEEIKAAGYPIGAKTEEITEHSGIILSYNEEHEMANWVAHMILPQVKTGNISRTNDFRPDSTISTGTAVEKDYFLKTIKADSSYEYDGYGYDRGHLAPSADYRWSKKAMSATYYYSNMTPQRPDFNRDVWAKLENFLRDYVIKNNSKLLVYTGPVLNDKIGIVERSINKISLPDLHYKIAWDKNNKRAIGFLMPNNKIEKPLENYTVTIDSIESITNLDFFTSVDDKTEAEIESKIKPEKWFTGKMENDKLPLTKSEMPSGAFNTLDARAFMGSNKKVTVCGTVVSSYKSGKGNTFLNLDKSFPNQIFTVTIWDDYQANFPYKAHKVLENKKICVKGKVMNFGDKPAIYLKNENNLQIID